MKGGAFRLPFFEVTKLVFFTIDNFELKDTGDLWLRVEVGK